MEFELLMQVTGGVIALLSGIVGFTLRQLYKRLEKVEDRLQTLDDEMADMKDNYIDRFSKATDNRTEIKTELLASINEMKLDNEKSHNAIIISIREELRNNK